MIPRPRRQHKTPESQWFWDHYDWAPKQIADFCEQGGIDLAGTAIADVGCGDGIMALGLCDRVHPASLVGFDVVPTNADQLLARVRAEGVADRLPPELEFRTSTPQRTPAPDAEFDFVYSWSAFEHIAEPVSVLREIRRILRPTGHFFLQLWPFYASPRGSHLWDWFDDEFHHLKAHAPDVVAAMAASDRHPPGWTEYMTREYQHLNRITVDELQRSVIAAGFDVHRLELLTAAVHLTPELARYSWTDLGIGGIKLIALPRP